jgi:exodeoxyribonuclease VII small subunit
MAGRTKKKTYEEAVERLEEIVKIMEDDSTGLEEAVKLYKEGVELSVYCSEKLNAAEQEVFTLKKTASGVFEKKPFYNEEM